MQPSVSDVQLEVIAAYVVECIAKGFEVQWHGKPLRQATSCQPQKFRLPQTAHPHCGLMLPEQPFECVIQWDVGHFQTRDRTA